MFHISNLGSFGGSVKQYADMNGFVPQAGDKIENFSFDVDTGRDLQDAEVWAEFVNEAVAATVEAKASLRDWQEAR